LLESDPQSCSKPIAPGGTCIMLALLQPLTSGYKAAYLQIGNSRAVNLLAEIAP
jgi:hypothetical protein